MNHVHAHAQPSARTQRARAPSTRRLAKRWSGTLSGPGITCTRTHNHEGASRARAHPARGDSPTQLKVPSWLVTSESSQLGVSVVTSGDLTFWW